MLTKNHKSLILATLFAASILFFPAMRISLSDSSLTAFPSDTPGSEHITPRAPLSASSETNFDRIWAAMDNKTATYNTLGYLPSTWDAGLSATYFALYSVLVTGQLDIIDTEAVSDYILSNYDPERDIPFIDMGVRRYLDQVDLEEMHLTYQYESVLLINCYAVLSLEILGKLTYLEEESFVNFVLDCYNLDVGAKGFIGLPYSASLPAHVRLPTLHNTYYAIKVLDLLWGGDFSAYPSLRDDIAQFICDLQAKDDTYNSLGGFYFDKEKGYGENSGSEWEEQSVNAVHNLWALDTVDILGKREMIDSAALGDYVLDCYKDGGFEWSRSLVGSSDFALKYMDIPASAINLALCKKLDLMGSISLSGVISYIEQGLNEEGYFYGSTPYQHYHEVLTTFQILRGLTEANEMFLTSQQKVALGEGIRANFYDSTYRAFTLLGKQHFQIGHLASLVRGLCAQNRLSEISADDLYYKIRELFIVGYDGEQGYFLESNSIYRQDDKFRNSLRMYPVSLRTNWATTCRTTNIVRENMGQKSTYFALEAIQNLGKLTDFHIALDLLKISNFINQSQVRQGGAGDVGAEKVGGFTNFPNHFNSVLEPKDYYYDMVQFEAAYYAIQTLNLIIEVIGGSYSGFGIDVDALVNYILYRQIENAEYLYLLPDFADSIDKDPALTLQYTYYMLKLLDDLGYDHGDDQKYLNLVTDFLDYTDINTVYYGWKIVNQLDVADFAFNLSKTRALIPPLVSKGYTLDFRTEDPIPDARLFGKVIELGEGKPMVDEIAIPRETLLGTEALINTSLGNLIYEEFSEGITVKYTHTNFGSVALEKDTDGLYKGAISIPVDSDYFPSLDGNITVYKNMLQVSTHPVSLNTTFSLLWEEEISSISDSNELGIAVEISRETGQGVEPVYEATVTLNVSERASDGSESHLETVPFTAEDLLEETKFTLQYAADLQKDYVFRVSYEDEFYAAPLSLFNFTRRLAGDSESEAEEPAPEEHGEDNTAEILDIGIAPLLITMVAAPSAILFISTRSSKQVKAKLKKRK